MREQLPEHLLTKFGIIEGLGHRLNAEATILDFGCGAGRSVHVLRDFGYKAYGCDIAMDADTTYNSEDEDIDTDSMVRQNILRLISDNPYSLPFEDGTFDFIFSEQVLEHVQNYSEVTSELCRILKPGGICLHIFRCDYLIESHVYVPFASIISSYYWLLFWASMRIRNEYQTGLSATETARLNFEYLRDCTNYLPKKTIKDHFDDYFDEVVFCEELFLRHSKRGRKLSTLIKWFPFLPSIYSTLKARVLFAKVA